MPNRSTTPSRRRSRHLPTRRSPSPRGDDDYQTTTTHHRRRRPAAILQVVHADLSTTDAATATAAAAVVVAHVLVEEEHVRVVLGFPADAARCMQSPARPFRASRGAAGFGRPLPPTAIRHGRVRAPFGRASEVPAVRSDPAVHASTHPSPDSRCPGRHGRRPRVDAQERRELTNRDGSYPPSSSFVAEVAFGPEASRRGPT